jgi:hypothetical protein
MVGANEQVGTATTGPAPYAELLEASLDDPRDFTATALEILKSNLDLAAAAFYVHSPESSALLLRSQLGFAPKFRPAGELDLTSLLGRSLHGATLKPAEELSVEIDQVLAPQLLDSPGVVAIPLRLPERQASESRAHERAPDPLGVLCLYPRGNEELPASRLAAVVDSATSLCSFLPQLYLAALDRHAMSIRRATVERVAYRKDISSLAYTFMEVVRRELPAEAASLWIVDPRREVLQLRKSTGLASGEPERTVPGMGLHDESLHVDCLESRSSRVLPTDSRALQNHHVIEALDSQLQNAAFLPIPLPETARLRGRPYPSAGVLVLLNHFVVAHEHKSLVPFGWDEVFLAEFACELLSVLIYQILRTQDHERDFERLMHGARTSLQASRNYLQSLDALNLDSALPKTHQYFIPNALDWLEDLEEQINRDELVAQADLEVEDVNLYGAVLAKLEPMAKRMSTRAHDAAFTLVGMDALARDYKQLIPKVRGNKTALNCVFRNLLDNSRKYSEIANTDTPMVTVTVRVRGHEYVIVRLEDNGIGVPSEDRDSIFEDTFRGSTARAVQPQGVGRGLFDCKRLLKKMGGDIHLLPSDGGAVFEVLIPIAAGSVDDLFR